MYFIRRFMYGDVMKNLPQDTINTVWPKETLEEVDWLKNQIADRMTRNPMRQQYLNRISTETFLKFKKYLFERFGEPEKWTWETAMKQGRLSDPKAMTILNDFYSFVFIQEIKKRARDFVPWIPHVKVPAKVNRQPSTSLKQVEEKTISPETKQFVEALKKLMI